MADTSSRMLQLLRLLQSRRDWDGRALADELGVSDRTIRRDIDTLRQLGYVVDAARGAGGHYRLGAGNELLPVAFDDEQAIAVAVALQVAPRTIAGLSAAAQAPLTRCCNSCRPGCATSSGTWRSRRSGTPGTWQRPTCTETSC